MDGIKLETAGLDIAIEVREPMARALEIRHYDRLVVQVGYDGSVEFGEGVSPGSAAEVFYESLARLLRGQNRLQQAIDEVAVLRDEVMVPRNVEPRSWGDGFAACHQMVLNILHKRERRL